MGVPKQRNNSQTNPPGIGLYFYVIISFVSVNQYQGHPTTVFCKMSVQRSKYCLEISIAQEKLKISR